MKGVLKSFAVGLTLLAGIAVFIALCVLVVEHGGQTAKRIVGTVAGVLIVYALGDAVRGGWRDSA